MEKIFTEFVESMHLGLKVDGIFGAGTKAKLVEWQKAHGLAADGICGMATWSSF